MTHDSKSRSRFTNDWYEEKGRASLVKPHIFLSKGYSRWFVATCPSDDNANTLALLFRNKLVKARAKS